MSDSKPLTDLPQIWIGELGITREQLGLKLQTGVSQLFKMLNINRNVILIYFEIQ